MRFTPVWTVTNIHIHFFYILVGDKKVQNEATFIFSQSRINPPQGGSISRTASLFAEADRLITSLLSGNVAAVGRRSKHPKRKQEACSERAPKRKRTPPE